MTADATNIMTALLTTTVATAGISASTTLSLSLPTAAMENVVQGKTWIIAGSIALLELLKAPVVWHIVFPPKQVPVAVKVSMVLVAAASVMPVAGM